MKYVRVTIRVGVRVESNLPAAFFRFLFRSIGSISGVERSRRSLSRHDEETRSFGRGASKWHLDLAGALWYCDYYRSNQRVESSDKHLDVV